MAHFNFLKFPFLSAIIIFVVPVSSWADINHTFIKVSCTPEANTVIIQAFYVDNEAGAKKAKNHEKDTYYLGNLTKAKDGGSGVSDEVNACSLGHGQTISFIVDENRTHPRSNSLTVLLNNKKAALYSLADGGWTLEILMLTPDQFSFRHCTDDPGDRKPEDICTVWNASADKLRHFVP